MYASLEGTKVWTAHWHQNEVDRKAYIDAFSRCQEIVAKHHLCPEGMLLALDTYHDEVIVQKKQPFFSLARWFYNPAGAEEQAVRTAFDIVNSIKRRFL
jgi:hypothetical protein